MKAPKPSPKEIATYFFTQNSNNSKQWTCRCGVKREKKGTGYTNLMDHIIRAHEDYEEIVRDAARAEAGGSIFSSVFVSKRARNIWGWMEVVFGDLEPLNFVEKPFKRKHMKMDPICSDTFCKYMKKLTELVERKVELMIPSKFALIFDGWTIGSFYYVAVFSSYPAENANGYSVALLGFYIFKDEENHTAAEHRRYIEYVLQVYKKSWKNVVSLVGDNCSVNKALANSVGIPLVGCASHRYNLEVQDFIQEQESTFEKIQVLMTKLKFGIPAARLRKLTPFCAVSRNRTRWSSTFYMVQRYVTLRPFITALDDPSIDIIRPTPADDRKLDGLCSTLKELDGVTKELQKSSCTMSDARNLFMTGRFIGPYSQFPIIDILL